MFVTALHVYFDVRFGAEIGVGTFSAMAVVITAGSFVGGLGLVTFTHLTQVIGARESAE